MTGDMIDRMVEAGAKEIVLQTDLNWLVACATARACLAAGLRAYAAAPRLGYSMDAEFAEKLAAKLEKADE